MMIIAFQIILIIIIVIAFIGSVMENGSKLGDRLTVTYMVSISVFLVSTL